MYKAIYVFESYEWLEETFDTYEEAEAQRLEWVREYGQDIGTRSYAKAKTDQA